MRRFYWAAALVAAAVWVGCSSDPEGEPGGDGPPKLSGVAAVGAPIVGGTVTLKCKEEVSPNSATTGSDGAFELEVAPSALPCALQVTGGTVNGAPNPYPALHSLAREDGTVNITPLTDLVVALAVGADPSTWFAAADAAALETAAGAVEAAVDALAAALAEQGYDLPAEFDPLSTPFQATAEDDYDDLLEALAEASATAGLTHEDLLASAQSGTGLTLPEAPITARVHDHFVGTHELTFALAEGAETSAYTDGQSVQVVIGSDSSLTIGGKKLTDPFFRILNGAPHFPEIVWVDPDTKLSYALSDNSTGTFNEINLGNEAQLSGGLPAFLGQFRKVTGTGPELVTQFAGTHTKAYVFRGTPAWTTLTIGADGSLTFGGGAGPSITAAQLGEITDRTSCCGRVDVRPTIDISGDGAVDNYDTLSLFRSSTGSLKEVIYYDAARLEVGVSFVQGALPAHAGGTAPTTSAIQGTVGGTLYELPVEASTAQISNVQLSAFGQDASQTSVQWGAQWDVPGDLAVGQTYSCGRFPNQRVELTFQLGSNFSNQVSTANGGRCSITVTNLVTNGQDVTLLEATFVAELYPFKRDVAPTVVTDGFLRYAP